MGAYGIEWICRRWTDSLGQGLKVAIKAHPTSMPIHPLLTPTMLARQSVGKCRPALHCVRPTTRGRVGPSSNLLRRSTHNAWAYPRVCLVLEWASTRRNVLVGHEGRCRIDGGPCEPRRQLRDSRRTMGHSLHSLRCILIAVVIALIEESKYTEKDNKGSA